MSGPLINRSLTTIRTELEFLKDSEVIDDSLYERLFSALPSKYQKDMKPWGVDKLSTSNSSASSVATPDSTEKVAEKLADTFAAASISAPPLKSSPPSYESKTLGYCRSIYPYSSLEPGDLDFPKGAKIKVVEHLSPDWYRGDYDGKTGVFPSNYTEPISKEEFQESRSRPPPPIANNSYNEKSSYNSHGPSNPPNFGGHQNTYDNSFGPPPQQQYNTGGYAQYPPSSTNYYQPPQQVVPQEQPVQPQNSLGGQHLRKFGGKLGNAAIFGAGATIGSDIVNSIF